MFTISDPRISIIADTLGPKADLHIVGGAVRDALMTNQKELIVGNDIDLATALPATKAIRILEDAGIRCVDVALKHSTVLAVPIKNQPGIEITTFRSINSEDCIEEGTSIEGDLALRDFTINSIAFSLNTMNIVDPLSGVQDLETRIIKASGDPNKRFKEDPLRILRLARFAGAFGFDIQPETLNAAIKSSDLVQKVSPERIGSELKKMLLSQHPSACIRTLKRIGVLKHILPEVSRLVGVEQNIYHKDDVFDHTMEVLDKTEAKLPNRLAALLHDISKPECLSVDDKPTIRHFYLHEKFGSKLTKSILKRLVYSNELASIVSKVVFTHMRPLDAGDGGLRRLLRDLEGNYEVWRDLKEADASSCQADPKLVKNQLQEFDQRMDRIVNAPEVHKFSNLAIDGDDLLELGFDEGPKIGIVLRAIHEEVINDPTLNEKEILISKAKSLLN